MDLFLKNMQLLASQDVNWWTEVVWITCGLLWCFYQLFGLSFWRHPFTAEDPLVSKWWNSTFLQTWWRNKLIYIWDSLRVYFQQTVISEYFCSFNCGFPQSVLVHQSLLFCTIKARQCEIKVSFCSCSESVSIAHVCSITLRLFQETPAHGRTYCFNTY